MPLEFTYGGEAEAPDGKADVIDVKGPGSFAGRALPRQDDPSAVDALVSRRRAARRRCRRGAETARRRRTATRAATHGRPGPEAPPPQIVDISMFLDDYKAVDGVMLPHHITRSMDGKPNEEWTFKTIKVNPAFKPDTFSAK